MGTGVSVGTGYVGIGVNVGNTGVAVSVGDNTGVGLLLGTGSGDGMPSALPLEKGVPRADTGVSSGKGDDSLHANIAIVNNPTTSSIRFTWNPLAVRIGYLA